MVNCTLSWLLWPTLTSPNASVVGATRSVGGAVSANARMKSHVAGNDAPGPRDVEMIPIARAEAAFVNQLDGTGCGAARAVCGPVTPSDVTE